MMVPTRGAGMPADLRFEEDLPRIAAEAFAFSGELCRSCGNMHALWSYIRLARASTGAEAAASRLQSVLSGLIVEDRRKLLIAGSQDTGLLALVARSCADPLEIAVLDRCETPLALCRHLAQSWSLPIETFHEDLTNLDIRGRFDTILVHGTLHYVAADRRADVLARLRRALCPDGRLVLLFNTGRRIDGDLVEESRSGYARWVIGELDRLAVPLPEEREAFSARLRSHAEQREQREGVFAAPEDVDALLADAGFAVQERFEIGVKVTASVQEFLAKIGKRRFLVVAEPIAGT
jgi:SAM-dependent methyltransferase